MSLTGAAFLVLVTTATVVAFGAAVVVWPMLSSNRPGAVLGRAGLLLAVNVLVLLTAATQLNAHYLFFSGWSDLGSAAGVDDPTASLSRGGSASGAVGQRLDGGGRAGMSAAAPVSSLPPLPANGVSRAGLVSYTVVGRASGLTGTVVVQLPPGYQRTLRSARPYPVIETFAGYPGTPWQWTRTMALGQAVQRAVAEHRMRSALIVSPQSEFPSGTDTECVNGGPGHPQVETWLAVDVPSWVEHTFLVDPARSSWTTMGLSAGGWCAAMATMLHPAQYSAAVVMGGYFRPIFGPFYVPYPDRGTLASRYDLVSLARTRPPPVALWLQTSHADATSFPTSEELLRVVTAPTAVDAVVLHNAGHRMSVWQGQLPAALLWLGTNVPGFGPAA